MGHMVERVLTLLLAKRFGVPPDPLVLDPRRGLIHHANEVALERRTDEGDQVEQVPAPRVAAVPLKANIGVEAELQLADLDAPHRLLPGRRGGRHRGAVPCRSSNPEWVPVSRSSSIVTRPFTRTARWPRAR